MANYQELANLVWNVADDVLRGLFKQHEYGDITLPFLVLRRLDCILDEDRRKEITINAYDQFKDKVPEDRLPQIIQSAIGINFYNTSQYDLSRLKADPNSIRLNFENYIGGFSAEHSEDLRGQGVIRSIFDPCYCTPTLKRPNTPKSIQTTFSAIQK